MYSDLYTVRYFPTKTNLITIRTSKHACIRVTRGAVSRGRVLSVQSAFKLTITSTRTHGTRAMRPHHEKKYQGGSKVLLFPSQIVGPSVVNIYVCWIATAAVITEIPPSPVSANRTRRLTHTRTTCAEASAADHQHTRDAKKISAFCSFQVPALL